MRSVEPGNRWGSPWDVVETVAEWAHFACPKHGARLSAALLSTTTQLVKRASEGRTSQVAFRNVCKD